MGRLQHPAPIERVGLGLIASVSASVINFLVARVLFRAGAKHHSIALEADAHHLMTDVWTSVGVVVGVALEGLTGWSRLDPVIAIAVAINIVWSGSRLLYRSAKGLLDTALVPEERKALGEVLARYAGEEVQFHAVRTRQAAAWRFVDLHVLVPGAWSVKRGHDLCEAIERDVREVIPNVTVLTHLEPMECPASFEDQGLHRAGSE